MEDVSRSAQLLTSFWLAPWQLLSDMLTGRGASLAPETLTQPILPGWIFANSVSVTGENSSAPDTERAIVATHSYGRQLGRVMDAVEQLIDEQPKGAQRAPAFRRFRELRDEIEEIKIRETVTRIERLTDDLAQLKRESPDEYRRLATALRAALDDKPATPR